MSLPHPHSLRNKLMVAGLLLQAVLLAGYYLATSTLLRDSFVRDLKVVAAQTSDILNLAISPYAVSGNLNEVADYLHELTGEQGSGLRYVAITDETGRFLLASGRAADRPLPAPDHDLNQTLDRGVLHYRQDILLSDNRVGHLQFGLSTGEFLAVLQRMLQWVLWLNLGAFALVLLGLTLFGRWLDHRLKHLMEATDALAEGHYERRIEHPGHDELSRLARNFNRMAEAVASREKKFSSVFSAAPLPMLLLRRESECLQVQQANPAAKALLPLEQLTGGLRGPWQVLADALTTDRPNLQREVLLPVRDRTQHAFLISSQHFELPGERLLIAALTDFQALRDVQLELVGLNNSLEQRIEARTAELAGRNQELAEALQHLQQMQEQLVQADKLSGLGSIVAAVAHELNTPIGNALTVATTLQELHHGFTRECSQGLRRSALEEFQQHSLEAADMLVRNLHRAAELIRSFKGVAVDRTSSQRRHFELAEVVQETLLTLGPSLRHLPYRIDSQIPAGIVLDSYPGPLGQIISNLINNAIVHAFDGREQGLIKLHAEVSGEWLELQLCDDGCGIAPEHLKRIFDPFFTTRLGQGGSGLGLNIVYNLACGLLGGSIRAESLPGQGTTFHLRLPLTAPAAEDTVHD